jgi:indole-3-glycerol phosphate synthase
MSILDDIIAYKKGEVEERKSLYPVKLLEKSVHFPASAVSLKHYLSRKDKCGIIAEIKRKSPSRGMINPYVSIERISIGYMQAGAAALSILTDEKFFGGSNADLTTARRFNFCPILRKDFIVDEYQVIEAKSIGADVILLIAAALKPARLKELAGFARTLGLEVLMEVHNEPELMGNLHQEIDIIGVNNRDLKTFKVSVRTSIELSGKIPGQYMKISESGISSPSSVLELRQCGYQGFLIGEYFMDHSRPEKRCGEFIHKIREMEKDLTAKNDA